MFIEVYFRSGVVQSRVRLEQQRQELDGAIIQCEASNRSPVILIQGVPINMEINWRFLNRLCSAWHYYVNITFEIFQFEQLIIWAACFGNS